MNNKNPRTLTKKFAALAWLFLAEHQGSTIPWNEGRFWGRCHDDLLNAYQSICCYLAIRLMRKRRGDLTEKESEDSSSVEHFIPKSTLPALAYEWSNYRLASRKVNKFRDKKDILDPFKVENGWFRLEVAGGDLYANPDLPDLLKEQVEKTILNLGLNEDWCIRRRQQYYNVYNTLCEQGHSTEKITQYLSENAPILLVELRLQGRLP